MFIRQMLIVLALLGVVTPDLAAAACPESTACPLEAIRAIGASPLQADARQAYIAKCIQQANTCQKAEATAKQGNPACQAQYAADLPRCFNDRCRELVARNLGHCNVNEALERNAYLQQLDKYSAPSQPAKPALLVPNCVWIGNGNWTPDDIFCERRGRTSSSEVWKGYHVLLYDGSFASVQARGYPPCRARNGCMPEPQGWREKLADWPLLK